MSEAITDRPLLFVNIVPCIPGQEAATALNIIEYTQRTGNDIVLACLTLHPEGFPARNKADKLIAAYRNLKAELAGTSVQLGVLLQSVLGHWPRVDKDEENWTRTIDVDGKISRFCPLDVHFQDYITYVVSTLARENPCMFLGDDDIRAFSPHAECFCPLHVAEFNKRLGTSYTSEEMRQAIKASQIGDNIYTAFHQLQRDTICGVAKLIRQAINSVNPAIPAGACCPGWEKRFCDATARAIGGDHPVILRIANANYMEGTAKDFPAVVLESQQQRLAHQDIPIVLDESDTYPHHLYSRSSTSFHVKLCSSIMSGLNGAKLWYVNTTKGGYPVSRNYTDILAKHKKFYPALAEEVRKTTLSGVVIPANTQFLQWHPASNWWEVYLEHRNWGDTVFGHFGIPFRCSFSRTENDIYAIAGTQTVRRFTDDELTALLSRKLLLDGDAAIELTTRGFAQYLGLTAEQKPFRYNREIDLETSQPLPTSSGLAPFITVTAPDAQEITRLGYEPFSYSGQFEEVAPGAVLYKNSLGGTVCVTSYNMRFGDSQLAVARKHWLHKLLNKINNGIVPCSALDEQDITVLTRKGQGCMLAMVVNLNFDTLEELHLTCAAKPSKILKLTSEGCWESLPFGYLEHVVQLPADLHCYESLTLKIVE